MSCSPNQVDTSGSDCIQRRRQGRIGVDALSLRLRFGQFMVEERYPSGKCQLG